MLSTIKKWFGAEASEVDIQKHLEELKSRTPVPVFWLFGKTQSGKSSNVRFLTGAEDAEIGQGFQACTKFSTRYEFPTPEAPLLTFLDTRGVDEAGYDAKEDLERYDSLAHVVIVTVKVTDMALENLIANLQEIRDARPTRPVVLVLTCLHEAYPQQQHIQPHESVRWTPDTPQPEGVELVNPPGNIRQLIEEQRKRFAGLYDHLIPIDLTQEDEGYEDPNYGGEQLKKVLLDSLPNAYRQTFITLEEVTGELSDLYAQAALPHILAYSSMAATAGAIPIPGVDLLLVPGIQARMVYHLARFYGQELTGERFLELAGSLGLGILARQAVRQVAKFIPGGGSVVGAAFAGAATFALGKAFCYYYSAVHKGHVPKTEDIKKYYREQLSIAEKVWKAKQAPPAKETPTAGSFRDDLSERKRPEDKE